MVTPSVDPTFSRVASMGSCIEQPPTPRHDSASLHVQTTLFPVKEASMATARWRP